jgi:hypothetical protein
MPPKLEPAITKPTPPLVGPLARKLEIIGVSYEKILAYEIDLPPALNTTKRDLPAPEPDRERIALSLVHNDCGEAVPPIAKLKLPCRENALPRTETIQEPVKAEFVVNATKGATQLNKEVFENSPPY